MYLDKLDSKSAASSSRPRPASGASSKTSYAATSTNFGRSPCTHGETHEGHRGNNQAREGPPLAESFVRACSRLRFLGRPPEPGGAPDGGLRVLRRSGRR
jgi:hypothetical protein